MGFSASDLFFLTMPKQRTSLDEQISAIAKLIPKFESGPRCEGGPLRDAVYSLSQLKKIKEEASSDCPDADRIADLMVSLVLGN